MKTLRHTFFDHAATLAMMLVPCFAHSACGETEITRPEVVNPVMPEKEPVEMKPIDATQITRTTVFNSGTDAINSYRIPTIATATDGSLLVAGEGRHTTWVDKSKTDVVIKRSTDGGKTWSAMKNLTSGVNSNHAFMDPLLIVEKNTGKIWMFCVRWPAGASNAASNRAFACTSTDNGASWSAPVDVTATFAAEGAFISGFGPGSGFQIAEGRFEGRLIVPTRQTTIDGTTTTTLCQTVYSDDKGVTWKIGEGIKPAGECQMADCGDNTLTLNVRAGGGRRAGFSTDGGVTWSAPSTADAAGLPGTAGGCQASVWGIGATNVLFCGIQGGTATSSHDDRCRLTIYRSEDGARSWSKSHLLYEKASGYCCMTTLNDGRIAIVFEAGDGDGFTKVSSRPAGWMRLDVMVLPKEVTNTEYWFE